MTTRVAIKPSWLKNELALMCRISAIVCGSFMVESKDEIPFNKNSGWQLDTSKDWFARVVDGQLEIKARYRYQAKKLETLATFIQAWLR